LAQQINLTASDFFELGFGLDAGHIHFLQLLSEAGYFLGTLLDHLGKIVVLLEGAQ
jgi:hypothetical protein